MTKYRNTELSYPLSVCVCQKAISKLHNFISYWLKKLNQSSHWLGQSPKIDAGERDEGQEGGSSSYCLQILMLIAIMGVKTNLSTRRQSRTPERELETLSCLRWGLYSVFYVQSTCVYCRVFVLSVTGYRFWCSLCRYLSAYPRPALVTFLTSAPVLQQLVTVIFAPSWQLSHDMLTSHWSMPRNIALLLVNKGREHYVYE